MFGILKKKKAVIEEVSSEVMTSLFITKYAESMSQMLKEVEGLKEFSKEKIHYLQSKVTELSSLKLEGS